MKQITLGSSGILVPPLAVGCMGLGGGWNDEPLSPGEITRARTLVETALEAGLNLFDHADIYTFGKAETVFGALFRENPSLRDRVILQTKAGIKIGGRNAPVGRYDLSTEYLRSALEDSLKRLNTEYVDLYILHRPDPLWRPEEIARLFEDLTRQGKVRTFGVSNMNATHIRHLSSFLKEPLAANQVEISLGHRDFVEAGVTWNHGSRDRALWWAEGTLEECRERDIRLQAWSPLAGGRFTGSPRSDQDRRTGELVVDLANSYSVSAEAIVLAWLMKHPAGIQPVTGTTKPERLKACVQAVQTNLSSDDWYRLWVTARGEALP